MTKPVTSVAAMMLVEEGKLDLDAPVAKYLPELKDRRSASSGRPAKRQPWRSIDLLRHTSGLTYPEEGIDALHRIYNCTDVQARQDACRFRDRPRRVAAPPPARRGLGI